MNSSSRTRNSCSRAFFTSQFSREINTLKILQQFWTQNLAASWDPLSIGSKPAAKNLWDASMCTMLKSPQHTSPWWLLWKAWTSTSRKALSLLIPSSFSIKMAIAAHAGSRIDQYVDQRSPICYLNIRQGITMKPIPMLAWWLQSLQSHTDNILNIKCSQS